LLAGKVRPKRHCRLSVKRDVELSELLVAVEIAADAGGRHLLFGVAEPQAVDLFGALQRVLADLGR